MKSKELQALWNAWLVASDTLLSSLHEQTVAITLRDVARVEKLQPELDAKLARMAEIDAQAVDLSRRLAESLGAEPTLRGIVERLDRPEGQALHGLANRVVLAARKVQETMAKNKALLQNEMTYINGTLTLIAKSAATQPTPYRRRVTGPVLMNAAA